MSNKQMRTTIRTIEGEERVIALCATIIRASQWFQVVPMPDGYYQVEVKRENAHLLPLTTKGEYAKIYSKTNQ